MPIDFAALAKAVVSGVSDVRTCLIVSRDGLALGAFPAAEEEKALTVWSRVASLGEVDRGFVALRDEVWAFCRRGPYAAVATSHPTARPGVILDQLEQMLLAAEEARLRKETFRSLPEREPPAEASRGPRTPLHAPREDAAVEVPPEDEPAIVHEDPAEAEGPVALGDPTEEIDPVLLSREFHGLLEISGDDDQS